MLTENHGVLSFSFDIAAGAGQHVTQDEARVLVAAGGATLVSATAGHLLRLMDWSVLPPKCVSPFGHVKLDHR